MNKIDINAISLFHTNENIYPVWDLKWFDNSWLIRTDRGIYRLSEINNSVNWFVEISNENMFSFKPMVLIEDVLVFAIYLPDIRQTYLKALNAKDGKILWEKPLNWQNLGHLTGILPLKDHIVLFDWLSHESKDTILHYFSAKTGELTGTIPASSITSNSLAVYGPKSAVSTLNYAYFSYKNNVLYQFDIEAEKLKPLISGKIQQVVSTKDFLLVYLWENSEGILLKLNDISGKTEKFILPLKKEEEIDWLIINETNQKQFQVLVLLKKNNGIALVDFALEGWKWHLNDGKTRFSYAIWTPYGVACIAHTQTEKGYNSEVWLLDNQTGTVLEKITPPLLENWLGWQNNLLLISSGMGLLSYKLSDN